MKQGFTDIHQHLMFGMDDGPEQYEGSKAMLLAAAQGGIARVCVTPHAVPGIIPFDINLYYQKLDQLQTECAEPNGVQLYPGAEVFYTDMARRHLDDKRVPTLNDTEYVLLELDPNSSYRVMFDALSDLSSAGYVPVLAHVERYHCLVSVPRRMNELKKRFEIRFQMNCYTITRKNGLMVSRFLKRVLNDGLIDAIATDAHNANRRLDQMPAAHKIVSEKYGETYADLIAGVHGGFLFPEEAETNEQFT